MSRIARIVGQTPILFFIAVSSIPLFILFTFAFTKIARVQVERPGDYEVQNRSELCAPVESGLKFCTSSPKQSVIVGERIRLTFLLSNLTEREILVNTNLDTSYSFVLTTDTGAALATRLEKKLKDGTLSESQMKDIIASTWISRRPDDIKLTGTRTEEIILSDIYEIEPGQYTVQAFRTTKNPNGEGWIKLALDRIEITVKPAH